MTTFQEEDRIKELEALITKARDDYYNKTPTVSDEVYDAWVDELEDLNAVTPYLKAVGAPPVSEWVKVKHLADKRSSLGIIADSFFQAFLGTRKTNSEKPDRP